MHNFIKIEFSNVKKEIQYKIVDDTLHSGKNSHPFPYILKHCYICDKLPAAFIFLLSDKSTYEVMLHTSKNSYPFPY